jgi:uncharacterized membrane protein (DUF106 family)
MQEPRVFNDLQKSLLQQKAREIMQERERQRQQEQNNIPKTFVQQLSETYNKNQNLVKVSIWLIVLLMFPTLIFFPILYYLVRNFTNDTKYITLLVFAFAVLITQGLMGTLKICLVLLALTLMWNYDNIYYFYELFTPAIDNKIKKFTYLFNIYLNKALQIHYVNKVINEVTFLMNNEAGSKLGKIISSCEFISAKILILTDYLLNNIVNHFVILLISSIEKTTETIINNCMTQEQQQQQQQQQVTQQTTQQTNSSHYYDNNNTNINNISSYACNYNYSSSDTYERPCMDINYLTVYDRPAVYNEPVTDSTSYNYNNNANNIQSLGLLSAENIDDIFKASNPETRQVYQNALCQEQQSLTRDPNTFLNHIDEEYNSVKGLLNALNNQ